MIRTLQPDQGYEVWIASVTQGTLDVNSWSPGSGRFAFVAYPLTDSSKD